MELYLNDYKIQLDYSDLTKTGRAKLVRQLSEQKARPAQISHLTKMPRITVYRDLKNNVSKLTENDTSDNNVSKLTENDTSDNEPNRIQMSDDEALLFVRTSVTQFRDSDEVSWDTFAAKRGLFSLNVLPQFLQKGIKELEEKKLKRWAAATPEYCLRFFALESEAPLWDEWAAPRGIPLVKNLTKEIQEQIRKVERKKKGFTWEDAY